VTGGGGGGGGCGGGGKFEPDGDEKERRASGEIRDAAKSILCVVRQVGEVAV